jgi:hypothetical protein
MTSCSPTSTSSTSDWLAYEGEAFITVKEDLGLCGSNEHSGRPQEQYTVDSIVNINITCNNRSINSNGIGITTRASSIPRVEANDGLVHQDWGRLKVIHEESTAICIIVIEDSDDSTTIRTKVEVFDTKGGDDLIKHPTSL